MALDRIVGILCRDVFNNIMYYRKDSTIVGVLIDFVELAQYITKEAQSVFDMSDKKIKGVVEVHTTFTSYPIRPVMTRSKGK